MEECVVALEKMVRRWEAAQQNWEMAVVDAHHSNDFDLAISIRNTALAALSGFPIKEAKEAIAKAYGV